VGAPIKCVRRGLKVGLFGGQGQFTIDFMATKAEVLEYLRKNPGAFEDEFQIKRVVQTKKQTFEVEVDLLDAFYTEAKDRKLKIKEAIDEALRSWVGRR
jgi:hypothetical protein